MPRFSVIASLAYVFTVTVFAQVVPGPGSSAGPTSVIVGQIQTATGGAINRGTLTFTLSQPAVVSGSASIATQQTACYTSAAGNIVGVPDPLPLPVTSTNTGRGTLPAGTYYVELYYIGAGGVSAQSPEAVVNLTSQGTVNVNAPALQPSSASGFYGVAIGTSSGAETIQGTLTSWTQYQQSTALVSGSTPPVVNTSSCSLYFSDQLIPTGTYYTVNLLNKNGSKVAGFPQTWCTYGGAGATINVSNGAPTGNCNTNGVFYPTPIFANPPNATSQGISTGLNVAGALNAAGPLGSAALNVAGPETVTNAGTFTNTQMNEYVTSSLNGGNAGTMYSAAQGGNFATESISGAILVPGSANIHQIDGIAGYVDTNAVSSPLGSNNNGVAVYGQCRDLVSATSCWGANFVAVDTVSSSTNHELIGVEIDNNINTGTTPKEVWGLLFNGLLNGTVPPAVPTGAATVFAGAAQIYLTTQGTNPWHTGIAWSRGTVDQTAVQVDAKCFSGACSSAAITLSGNDGANPHTASLAANSSGDFLITPATGRANIGSNIPIVTSFTTTAATTDNVTVTGMTSSGHCSLQATNAGAAGGIASVFVSAKNTNQITVTHTATASWTFDVMCTSN